MLRAGPRISIPLAEFEFSYARSSGPGGQHVNKVNSKAILRWDLKEATLAADIKRRFQLKYRNRITTEGELVLSSQRYRDQSRNRDDVLEKLRLMLLEVATPPTRRKPTRPSRASKERRLKKKRFTAEKKNRRQEPGRD
jgi:ribosome-associated protein